MSVSFSSTCVQAHLIADLNVGDVKRCRVAEGRALGLVIHSCDQETLLAEKISVHSLPRWSWHRRWQTQSEKERPINPDILSERKVDLAQDSPGSVR